jgi:hypothetical protein
MEWIHLCTLEISSEIADNRSPWLVVPNKVGDTRSVRSRNFFQRMASHAGIQFRSWFVRLLGDKIRVEYSTVANAFIINVRFFYEGRES